MKVSERYKWKGLGRRLVLAALAVALVGVFVFGRRGLLKWDQLRRRCEAMELQNDSLASEINQVSTRIRKLEAGDNSELEKMARYWGMVRANEEIYIVRAENDTLHAQMGGQP